MKTRSELDFDLEVDRSVAQIRSSRPLRSGTLVRLVGLRLEARGIMAPVGSCCEVLGQTGQRIEAEVVGFSDKTLAVVDRDDDRYNRRHNGLLNQRKITGFSRTLLKGLLK